MCKDVSINIRSKQYGVAPAKQDTPSFAMTG